MYDCMDYQLYKSTGPKGVKLAHVLLNKFFTHRTILTRGVSYSNLHKVAVWASSCFVRFAVFMFLFINENNS